jgi:FAD/FMN-containing dehydrogenase
VRLIPARAATAPVAAAYPDAAAGCRALERVLTSGLLPAALEYLDAGALRAARGSFPVTLPERPGFMLLTELEGGPEAVAAERVELEATLSQEALSTHAPVDRRDVDALWRWRSGVTHAVIAQRGGKLSEDVAVPLDRFEQALAGTLEIGARHDLEACSWGHAGDGNLHATFLLAADDAEQVARAEAAAQELFALARRLGGSVSGEHGLGWAKRGQLERQSSPAALALHREVKRIFDAKGLLNPGKKAPMPA